MQVFNEISSLKQHIKELKQSGKIVGFVPTMGYLHDGHISLVNESVSKNDVTVASIFVNPMQFGVNEDYGSYPRDFERDSALLEAAGVDIIFHPSPEEMYGENFLTSITVENMSNKLCGISRPIHFKGVTTVVAKLFNIVTPDNAYFGSKDLQQVLIIKKMVNDLNMSVNVVSMPIIRESDGLAMSSRNIYLSDDDRKGALLLNQSLKIASQMIENNQTFAKDIFKAVETHISKNDNAQIDYISIIDTETLEPVEIVGKGCALLLAVKFSKARLIDNIVF